MILWSHSGANETDAERRLRPLDHGAADSRRTGNCPASCGLPDSGCSVGVQESTPLGAPAKCVRRAQGRCGRGTKEEIFPQADGPAHPMADRRGHPSCHAMRSNVSVRAGAPQLAEERIGRMRGPSLTAHAHARYPAGRDVSHRQIPTSLTDPTRVHRPGSLLSASTSNGKRTAYRGRPSDLSDARTSPETAGPIWS